MEKFKLNFLEEAILNEIACHNGEKYLFLKKHISQLVVKSREYTRVGCYVTFEYLTNELPHLCTGSTYMSSSKSLELDTLKYGLNYDLNITNGVIDFLELVTNGESWDGNYTSFTLEHV